MKPKSHTLFHFTKSAEVLRNILNNGFLPRYCLEDVGWVGFDERDYVAYPMVCFCDIPLGRINEHVDFYGSYGLGMRKEWAIANGLNPIWYVTENNSVVEHYKRTIEATLKIEEENNEEKYVESIRHILAFAKPVEGRMVVSGSPVNKEFYQESEWRYVPIHPKIQDHMGFKEISTGDNRAINNNLVAEHCALKFSPTDVKYIFVRHDSDIPHLVNFINTELDNYPSAALKILTTRIISIESIENDI